MENISLISKVHPISNPVCENSRTYNFLGNRKFVIAILTTWVLICVLGFLVGPSFDSNYYADFFIHYDKHVNLNEISPQPCSIEDWNQKNTSSFPFHDLYKEYAENKMTGQEGLYDGQLRLLTAFLYDEYIVVTHTAQNPTEIGRIANCHYFDCNRIEIPGSLYKSFTFPMTAVHCPRRAGAKYMSLSFEENGVLQEPIPLLNRILKDPPHEIGVCVGQIYGAEKKWLEIIEYIEHHKLMGASMFYFTILEMDGYSKRTIEEYQRLGEIEATYVNTEYEKITWMFHMIQVHECFFRSKFHSKWVINVDIDERLVLTEMPLLSYLRQQPPSTCEINFGSRRVAKFHDDPPKYISQSQIKSSIAFLRYNLTSSHHWGGFKSLFKPEKIHMIHFHWTWRQHEGCVIKTAPEKIGYVRHYRTTSFSSLGGHWFPKLKPYWIRQMDKDFVKKLRERVMKKVKYIYEMHPVYCKSIDPWIRKIFVDDLHCVE